MKKLAMTFALALMVSSAMATEVGMSYVHDHAANENGVRVEVGTKSFYNVTPKASVTYIENVYTRYAVGGDVNLVKLGAVDVTAAATGFYNDATVGENGFGVTVGAKASVPVSKHFHLVAGYERVFAQDKIQNVEGNVFTAGIAAKF
jgi:hypothetical protein